MSTSSRPCRVAALTALTAGAAVLLAAPSAVAAPGDQGVVRVLPAGTGATGHLGQPKVCRFYLDASRFDGATAINWTVAPTNTMADSKATLTGVVNFANGAGASGNLVLPAGQYRLTWKVAGPQGVVGRPTVFKLDCKDRTGRSGPHGGPPAGGGGLAREDAFTPVAGAAAVGLVAVGGVTWFRLRRRTHGAA
ncbi:hypothetical protein [Streptomyces sp. SID13726]|uniref:hypothetical protein n=1 Tax=Streptomyces sp. SID13726 TaxID=2706058 RepID=UPI0013B6316B|nr:hypothetical protein [Streptomyces sp. SID13726]NEB02196.1 hypothetical protein [Streptomyces sp. SID13726]